MTTVPQTRENILDSLQQNSDRFTNLLNRYSPEEMQRPFTDEGWSIKDIIAHIAYWSAAKHRVLVAELHDQPLPPVIPLGDEANAEQHRHDAALSLQEVVDAWQETQSYLRHMVLDEFDETALTREVHVPWDEHEMRPLGESILSTCIHNNNHFDQIEHDFPASLEKN